MRFAELQQEAARVWDEIPEDYRSGVDGLVIERKAQAHPSLPDIYTLGECLTESYPSDWGGPDTTRSVLVLYYGSFRRLSELDPEFDWEYEIWETVTHELRHHLESLAAEDALEDVDYAMDENFKRLQGDPFDPEFYRYGEPLAPGVFAAERDIFIEIEYDAAEPPGPRVPFDWRGGTASVERPAEIGDIAFLQVVEGIDLEEQALCIVLVRRRRWLEKLQAMFRSSSRRVVEAEVVARPA
jgi:hypothetical protein